MGLDNTAKNTANVSELVKQVGNLDNAAKDLTLTAAQIDNFRLLEMSKTIITGFGNDLGEFLRKVSELARQDKTNGMQLSESGQKVSFDWKTMKEFLKETYGRKS
jgi:hypothetical protein